MIALRQLDIGYRKRNTVKKVFSGIEAEFFAGDLVGLMGDNGAGKSTLLKTITGVLAPLSGEVLLSGKSLTTYSSAELAKILSIVTTERVGGFNLRVRDIVAIGRTPYINVFGKLGDADVVVIDRCMEQMGIDSLADAFVDELSDGQRQKVMIAKSLAQQTPVIVLDEPTAFLDYTSRQQLFQTLRTLCENERKLILVSSHDLDLMASHITRSVVLETGKGVLIT